jgi:hypothetical protein
MKQRPKPNSALNSALHPVLLSILDDATSALAHMDAEKLEELVHGSRDLLAPGRSPQEAMVVSAQLPALSAPLQQKLDAFARFLDLTRENLLLMRRLGASSASQIEYSAASLAGGRHGNN